MVAPRVIQLGTEATAHPQRRQRGHYRHVGTCPACQRAARLRGDAPAGMRSWATFLDTIGAVRGFEHILDAVRTGRPGFDAAHGTTLFEWLDRHPDAAAAFDSAMSERTAAFAPSVAVGYDFSDVRSVVDVGGGRGTLLVDILRHHAHIEGVLFELPAVAARARGTRGH